ncbi:uncharacterized protein PAF06_001257 [Gastrophryne carolinensis]
MELEQSHMTEMICDLALEIIYLLTGEKHAAVKMASIEGLLRGVYPPMSAGGSMSQASITKPPSHSGIPDSSNQKILEVIKKIAELLAGEVRGVGVSMDNKGNADEDLLLDSIMEVHRPLASPDWWHPGYSRGQPYDIQLLALDKFNDGGAPPSAQIHFPSAEKPYPCPECGKCFGKKLNLTRHRKTHTREKLHSCEECGKGFYQKSNLHEHRKTHTGEKPYSCSECGRSFCQKAVLSRHEKIHTGERPYTCIECGRSFSRKSHLTDHRRTHTGEKVYSCCDCGKSFAQKSNLNTHRKYSHREKTVLML